MEKKNIKIKDIMQSLRLLPQTLSLLNKIEKKLFVKVVIVSLLTGIFPIVTLLFSQELLNSLVVDGKLKYTFFIFISYIMVSFLAFLVEEADEYVKTLYQYKLQFKLQYMLMQRCTRLSLRDFESAATYDRVEKISSGISYQPFQIFLAVTSIITAIVTMLSSVVIILLWKPVMALILLLVPILSLFYYLKIGQQEFDMMYNRAKEERKLWYFNHLLTHDFSYKEVKLLGIGEYILDKYREISLNFIKQNKRLLNKKTIFNILYGIIVQIIGFIIIGAAIVSAFLGRILVGNVISIIRAIGMIQSNSRVLMSNIYSIYSGSLYMEMLFRFLKEHEEEPLLEKGKTEINDFSDIRMENVCFSYDNKKETIKNVSLHISKGERVAIVGPNGSGKSTLLKILTGLYEPSEGEVFINQKSIKDIDMKGYYSKISVLFQDFMKYEFTLRENVGFGNIEKINDDDEMINVLKEMKIDFLKSSEDQYCLDMQLGNWFENGRELSQGQWQKIALARTCFKNAQCYILDEPNAALDTVSEREVFNRFFEISKDKIGIYISHRLSAAKMADKIIVMNEGEIAAIGQHEDLLNRSKIYQELFQAENYEMEISEYAK